MAKHPWMPFYVSDWATGTTLLSLAEKGVYIDLVAYQWDTGAVPGDDLRALARIARCDLAEIEQAWPAVSAKFTRGADGLWRNARVEAERAVSQGVMDSKRRGGQQRASSATRSAGRFAPADDQQTHQQDTSRGTSRTPANSQSQSQSQPQEEREARSLAPVVVMPSPVPRYQQRPIGGKHGDCLTGCSTGMCLHEEQAMELATRLPGGFTEDGLQQVVTWAQGVVEDHKLRGIGMRDKHEWDFWKHRWAEQFGGSAPTFAQLRAKRTQEAVRAAFNE
jgi:uncharacterized protein YdaU (DUF1376 family)